MKRYAIAALAALAVAAAPARAQQDREDCRCVDGDGNPIENCTCFRTPDVRGLSAGLEGMQGRPRLGISIDPTQSARRDADGALVADVLEDGPADEAGIREGDVITSVDGISLTESMGAEAEADFDLDDSVPVQRLLAITSGLEPGESVEVEYLRNGERRTTTVEVADLSERWGRDFSVAIPRWDEGRFRDQMRSLTDGLYRNRERGAMAPRAFEYRSDRGPDVRVFGGGADAWVLGGPLFGDGLGLVELNPGLGAYFGADEGVLVTDVGRDAGFGLEPGDVVLRIGDRVVSTPDRFRRILSSYADDEDVDFHILRNGEETVVTGRRRY
jgi:hypothetical protein